MYSIFGGLLTYAGFTAITNGSSTNRIIKAAISLTKEKYELEENDPGEFKKIMIMKILPFYTQTYTIKDLGVFSILSLNTGIMNVITININIYTKDLPQLTLDFIYMLNKRILLIEIYNMMINNKDEKCNNFLKEMEEINKKYHSLKDGPLNPNPNEEYLIFNKKKICNIFNESQLLNFTLEIIETYFKYIDKALKISKDDIKKKAGIYKEFSDKLVKKGGVAINHFKKSLKDAKTSEYLSKVFYGYNNYL